MRKAILGVFVIASVLVGVSAASVYGQTMKEKSLYDRLGGKKAITAVVDSFVSKVGADKRINGYFASTDLTKLSLFAIAPPAIGVSALRLSGKDWSPRRRKIVSIACAAVARAVV